MSAKTSPPAFATTLEEIAAQRGEEASSDFEKYLLSEEGYEMQEGWLVPPLDAKKFSVFGEETWQIFAVNPAVYRRYHAIDHNASRIARMGRLEEARQHFEDEKWEKRSWL